VLDIAVLTVLPGAVAFAAAMDLLTMKIPNRIPAVMVLAFFPLALLMGLGAWDILNHVAAGLGVLALGVLLFIPGWFGGGDAKLMAAIALWIGPENLLPYFVYAALTGGLLAMAFMLGRSVPLPRLLLGEGWALRLHRKDAGIPYGLALAAGALLVYPHTVWFTGVAH
jgi:prepilin peptidase CpaA